jgi:hypothetical protein
MLELSSDVTTSAGDSKVLGGQAGVKSRQSANYLRSRGSLDARNPAEDRPQRALDGTNFAS